MCQCCVRYNCGRCTCFTPIQYVLNLGPELTELLSDASRELPFIQYPDSIFILRMWQWNLDSATERVLILGLGYFAFLDVFSECSKCHASLLNSI